MLLARRIVVATDLSPASHAALEEAVRWLSAGAQVVVLLHVFDVSPWALADKQELSQKALRRVTDEAIGAASSVLLRMREEVFGGLSGVEVAAVQFDGAAAGVCAYAKAYEADLVIVSSRGRPQRHGVGPSVIEGILRDAPCRVLVVPNAPHPIAH